MKEKKEFYFYLYSINFTQVIATSLVGAFTGLLISDALFLPNEILAYLSIPFATFLFSFSYAWKAFKRFGLLSWTASVVIGELLYFPFLASPYWPPLSLSLKNLISIFSLAIPVFLSAYTLVGSLFLIKLRKQYLILNTASVFIAFIIFLLYSVPLLNIWLNAEYHTDTVQLFFVPMFIFILLIFFIWLLILTIGYVFKLLLQSLGHS